MDVVRGLSEERVDPLLFIGSGFFGSEKFFPGKLGRALQRCERRVGPISLQVRLSVRRSSRRPARLRRRRLTGGLGSREGNDGEDNGRNADESICHTEMITDVSRQGSFLPLQR